MKNTILILMLAAGLLMFAGCDSQETLPEPVTAVPEWTGTAVDEEAQDYEVLLFWDLTRSMIGFAGHDDSPLCETVVEMTNQARFDTNWHTYMLEPDEQMNLQWEMCDPLLVAAAVINREDDASYTTSGDFDKGGPVTAVFEDKADPTQVRVLVTDMLEQEGALNALYVYTEKLFLADGHQQVYIAIANSPYEGTLWYPRIKGETLVLQNAEVNGDRPFVVIVAGPEAGVSEVRQVLAETGVAFTEFLVENRRTSVVHVELAPAQILAQNILVESLSQAHCIVDLEPMKLSEDCFAYRYHKNSANRGRSARLALHAVTEADTALSLAWCSWMHWQPVEVPTETVAEETGHTANPAADGETTAAEPTEAVVKWEWVPCDPPEGVQVDLQMLESGSAISGVSADHSLLEDIVIPDGACVYELSVDLGEDAAAAAYSFQAELEILAGNPLGSADPFTQWDIPFSLCGQAEMDASILQKIPDLCLMLKSLIKLDAAADSVPVGTVRIVLQNYES